ncbi:MAG: family 43 glycosylhydrolase [Sedimentisphaerales bacterium]|nr:family 43 glycosylhydrolase [Sedimentisphaerales bacterium]
MTHICFLSGLKFFLLLTVCSMIAIAGQSMSAAPIEYNNPILPGDWSDPALIRVGDDYYTCRSSFGWQPGIPIAHSRDLIHWRYIGHAFKSHPELQPGDTRNGIWGLDMGFNPNTRQYLIYAPTRGAEIYVFYADRPEGPYAMKSLGKQLGIDPGFFVDNDGRLYLVTSQACIYELEPDGLFIKNKVIQLNRRAYRLFEGPDIFKRNNWYYLLFSDGGTLPHEPSTISCLRAHALTGPWETDPNNPVMFSTDNGARFEGPAHGTLIETQTGQWFVTFHAHEPSYYCLGREMLMQPVEWTPNGWWRPVTGKIPTASASGPDLPVCDFQLAQSDTFDSKQLGLQWFFTCEPDFSGKSWSLTERPGCMRIYTQPGDLGSMEALTGIIQQRVIHTAFSVETHITFSPQVDGEAAGLHMYHDPLMNLWLVSTQRKGRPCIEVGKIRLGRRTDLWSVPNPYGENLHLMIVVDNREKASFHYSKDGRAWQQIGESLYFGASAHHLRDGLRGDPDLGWVGTYKDRSITPEKAIGPAASRLPQRRGNTWTGATFGIFAVRNGAAESNYADFHNLSVTTP